MNLGKREVKKLEVIFSAKYDALKCEWQAAGGLMSVKGELARGNWWVDYCDRHNIEIMRDRGGVHAWVKECFNEKGKVICISSPESDSELLVPKNMAEKVLVLGYLP